MVTTLALALALTANVQNQQPTTPQDLAQLNFLLGTWEGKGTANTPDGKTLEVDGSANVSMVLDRWIQWDSTDNVPGQGMMSGRFMLTYNPATSMWEGTWFSNQASFATKFTGTLNGTTLTLNSEAVPNMDRNGSSTYTVTFTKTSETQMSFKLQTNMGGTNATMLDYVYTKR